MSSNTMLKQAIIDANALRDVALKNAEAIVVEKYSNQIKEAVDNMLEQEEEEFSEESFDMGMPGEDQLPSSRALDLPTEEPVTNLGDQIDLSATGGEPLCPCPPDGKTVTVNFGELQDMMRTLDQAGDEEVEFEEEEDVMPAPTPGEVLPSALKEEEVMFELDDLIKEDFVSDSTEEENAEAAEQAAENLEEDSGDTEAEHYADDAADDATRLAHTRGKHKKKLKRDMDYDERHIALQEEKKKVLKENTQLTHTNSQMLKENKHLLKEQQHILKENKEMKSLLKKVSGKLEEVNLSNAKLVYTNQVLSNGASLNERQKQRIVEAINNADSVEAAKSIFETLQSAVGSSMQSRDRSQSLSEAIVRGNATTLRQNKKQTKQDPHMERMKKLAGI